MINDLDKNVLNDIFSFFFENTDCFIQIKNKNLLFQYLYINKYIYFSLRKRCKFHFAYKPNNIVLSNIRECVTHCCKENNKIYIINFLNMIKRKRNNTVKEYIFSSSEDSNFIVPYLYDINLRVYKNSDSCSIYTINKYERFSSFL